LRQERPSLKQLRARQYDQLPTVSAVKNPPRALFSRREIHRKRHGVTAEDLVVLDNRYRGDSLDTHLHTAPAGSGLTENQKRCASSE
jgi:hypothetical protein